jgi:hypothetical protein
MLLAHLPDQWRTLAAQQRRFGAEAQARILEYCADELWGLLRAAEDELLPLHRAAVESGYTADHLGRLIREGKLPNAGRKARPLIRRKDLPIKPARQLSAHADDPEVGYISDRLFRDITTSKYGD